MATIIVRCVGMGMSKISLKFVWILTVKPIPTANALNALKAMN